MFEGSWFRYGKNETERSPQGTSLPQDGDGVLVVHTLLENSADINKKDMYELTPLHHAALRGNIKIVEFLLEQEQIKVETIEQLLMINTRVR